MCTPREPLRLTLPYSYDDADEGREPFRFEVATHRALTDGRVPPAEVQSFDLRECSLATAVLGRCAHGRGKIRIP